MQTPTRDGMGRLRPIFRCCAHFGDLPVSSPAAVSGRTSMINEGAKTMTTPLVLDGKRAAVFGGGASIGVAVAKELAAQGGEVFLAGRSAASIDLVAKQIEEVGGVAHARVVDALDTAAVDAFIASVVHETGSLDIEFNATGPRI